MRKKYFILTIFLAIFLMLENVSAEELGDPYIDISFDPVAKENKNHAILDVFENNQTAMYSNGTIEYGLDENGTYMEWSSNVTRGGGFNLNVDKAIGEEYTIVLKFSFTDTGELSGGWKKIIDFQKDDWDADSGLYFYDQGKTQFYPQDAQGPQIKNNEVVDLLIRRNKETQKFEVYNRVGDESILCYEFTDENGLSVLDSGLGFFHDDYATSGESSPGGKVYSVKIWDTWTEVEDVWDLLDKERDEILYYYKYFNGGTSEIPYTGDGEFSFTVDGDPKLFKDVKIGDINLEKDEDYIVTDDEGTLIEFTEKGLEKINALSKGEYNISVSYTNNETVTGKFVLENGPTELSIKTDGKTQNFYEGTSKNNDETLIYNSENKTLTLNNYNGGPIKYYGDEELTVILKGENKITSDGNSDGIISKNASLVITNDGSLEIENVINGIVTEKGSITITSNDITIQTSSNTGIKSNENIDISGKNIKVNSDLYGLYSKKEIDISGTTTINSSVYGIFTYDSLNIDCDYLEINTNEKSGAAIFVVTDNINSLNISNKLEIKPNDISNQKISLLPNNIDVITLGKENASASLGTNGTDLTTSNIENSLKIYRKRYITLKSDDKTIDILEILYGTIANEPAIPTKKGYIFDGWYKDKDFKESFAFDSKITGDVELYAKWIEDPRYYDYTFLNGDNQKLIIDNFSEYTFRINGDYSLFESVQIGEVTFLKDEDYTVTEGSTIITFTKNGIAKLNKFKSGKYKVLVSYKNGKKATGNVILVPVDDNPNTYDNIKIYIVSGLISLLGLISISVYKIKKCSI